MGPKMKPWAKNQNHALKIVRQKTVENNQKKKKWGSTPEPPNQRCRHNFGVNAPKPIGRELADYPTPTQAHVD